jgi:hypothetical protein
LVVDEVVVELHALKPTATPARVTMAAMKSV